jgi:hypothetical protein
LDPADLRSGLAERLASGEQLDAETLNAACFMLSRALESMEFSVPEAAPLSRRLLRVVGRLIIDTARPGADPNAWPNTEEMALMWIDEALHALGYHVTPHPERDRSELKQPEEDWM